jgi:23S rRNA (adenine2503-C2)-methyltransferase
VEKVTNVVFMGMGEPLANYEATWQAVRTLTDPRCFGLGARHLTISTVGLVPGIERLSKEPSQVGLAVSLHAPNDSLRDRLVPLNRRYPLARLLAACREYVERTGRRITFEYALIEGLNDSPQQAKELALLLEGLLCHVNLIPLNATPDCLWRGSSRKRASAFRKVLLERGVQATLRLGRGVEIQAGCGQLRSRPRIDFL